jgi:hypothetical protein
VSVEKFSVSFEPELGQAIREAADEDDDTVSAWLAEAARDRLRNLALGHALDELLAEAGLSEDQVLKAARAVRARAVSTTPTGPTGC